MIFLLCNPNAEAQQRTISITKPSENLQDGTPFFRLNYALSADWDSTIYVAHVYQDAKRVISYKISSIQSKQFPKGKDSILAVHISDTALIPDYPQVIKDELYRHYRVSVVESEDIMTEYPILTSRTFEHKTDTSNLSLPVKDTAEKKKPWITLHGNVTMDAQTADGRLLYQQRPQNYVRTGVNLQAEVAGLPFDAGYLYSTESSNITNFRVSFNHAKLYEALKQKVNKRIEADASTQLNNRVPADMNALNYEKAILTNKFNSRAYQADLARNKKLVAYGETDTAFRETRRYKKAVIEMDSFRVQSSRLLQLDSLSRHFSNVNRQLDIDANQVRMDSDKSDRAFKRALRRYKLTDRKQSLFLDIKRLDIGMCSPDYTYLVMNGASINGINVEFNPGNAYGAFTWGKTIQNFNDPFSVFAAGGRTIMAGRIGVGRTEKLLLAVSVLRGHDDLTAIITDSLNSYVPQNNYVLGADLKYKTGTHEMGLEYAQSADENRYEGLPRNGGFAGSFNSKYGKAWMGYGNFNFPETRTRIKVHTKVIDPYYYSFGTPFLRQDNFRMEIKGEQGFLRNQLTAAVTYRRDEDNLYNLKQFNTKYHSLVYTLHIKFRKLPVVMLLYSPNYQVYNNPAINRSFTGNVKIYQGTATYPVKWKYAVLINTVNVMKQHSLTISDSSGNSRVSQYGANESLTLMKHNLTISTAISYSYAYAGEMKLYGLLYTNVSISKGLYKNKITIGSGYTLQKDYGLGKRDVIQLSAAFSLPFRVRCQLSMEQHYIKNTDGNSRMNLGRITIIKPF